MTEDEIYKSQWIPDEWAVVGASRPMFIQCVLKRFCGPLIDELKLPEGIIYASEFSLGVDPAQLSIIDQLFASLLGYNWSIVGFISSTNYYEHDNLDGISRFEYVKARDFLENWTRTEGYRVLRPGPRSISFQVNLIESAIWKDGIIVGQEANSPHNFYQINRAFVKVETNETMHKFGDEIWASSNPMDFCKKVSTVSLFKNR